MTVASNNNKNTYTGDDSTTVFAYSFKIFAQGDILVRLRNTTTGTITTQTITTHYTVSGAGDASGGNITFVTAPTSSEQVILTRNQGFLQSTDYIENDTFPASSHEDALDELTMNDQQIKEALDRCISADPVSTFSGNIPLLTADAFLRINSDGDGVEAVTLSTTAGLGSVVEDLTPQLGGDLDANGKSIQFDDATGIEDDSGNEQLLFQKTSSAVNFVEVTNSATGSDPSITAAGDDTNVGITIDAKGTGSVTLGSADATVAVASSMTVIDEIQHAGDTDNKIGFTTDTQTYTTGGSSRMDITDSGVRLGGANSRVTTILDEDTMSSDSATALATQQSIKSYVDSNTGGALVQINRTLVSAATGTTTIPDDDTSPTNSEGTEISSLAITPGSTDNKVRVTASLNIGNSANVYTVVTVFRDSTLIGTYVNKDAADEHTLITIRLVDTPATVSSTTYSIRMGTTASGTWRVGQREVARYNGTMATFAQDFSVEEIIV
jgi:hypothetical protein